MLNGKPYDKSKDLFLLEHGWILFVIVSLQLFFIKNLGPKLMANRKAFNLRPYMLVFNGLNFGTLGCGIIVYSYALNFCADSWKCENNLRNHALQESAIIYSAYLYLIMKIGENMSLMIMVLRKKPNQNPMAMALFNNVSLLLAFLGLKYHPIDIFMLEPYLEAWRGSLRYAYYTLRSPESANKYHAFRKFINASCLFFDVVNTVHMVYLLYNGCKVSPLLMYGLICLSVGEFLYMTSKFVSRKPDSRSAVKVN